MWWVVRRFCTKVRRKPVDLSTASPEELRSRRVISFKQLYLVGDDSAEKTKDLLVDRFSDRLRPLIEVNPGVCRLTRRLLDAGFPSVSLFETNLHFQHTLSVLQKEYPDRVDYATINFLDMWRSAAQDKMDGGNRIEKLLQAVNAGREDDICVVGTLPSINFLKHLIMAAVFQDSLLAFKKPEFYLWMLPVHYCTFVCDEKSQNRSHIYYRPHPVLFNLLFDHEILLKMPRDDFMPLNTKSAITKSTYRTTMLNFDKEFMYLIRIVPKKHLPCHIEHLPLLWYFCKQHFLNKTNRVIPMLEHWIPSCGIWLITGQDPIGSNPEKGPGKSDAPLPHITVFTQFRDLSPEQNLTLFKRFISWPEFELSPFKEALENHIYKGLSSEYSKSEILDQEEKLGSEPNGS